MRFELSLMWKTYLNYPDLWKSMLSDIYNAKESVCFEQYIFTDLAKESIGYRFIDAFKEAAGRGAQVRLLLDGQGSIALFFSTEVAKMRECGIQVLFYTASSHKLSGLNLFKSFFRDHRKLLIVDRQIAHIGGGIVQQKAQEWGELNVRFEKSDVVKNLCNAFDAAWERLIESNAFNVLPPIEGGDGFFVISGSPRPEEHYILWEMVKQIKKSGKAIRISSPYFVPTYRMLYALYKAAARGIKIDLILPQKIDNVFAKFASENFYSALLRWGARIYLYGEYNHAKYMTRDGDWCTVGSTNFDRMALVHNYEINVATYNRQFVKELDGCFEKQISMCKELTRDEWKKRPIISKILEKLSFFVRPWA